MKKKKLLAGVVALSIGIGIGGVLINNAPLMAAPYVSALDNQYKLGLDKNNAPQDLALEAKNIDATIYTDLRNPIRLHYQNALSAVDSHVKLVKDGYISLIDALSGFTKISASFTGSLLIGYGFDANHIVSYAKLTSNYETYNLNGYNYFKIIAQEDTVIESLFIDFKCSESQTYVSGTITDIFGNPIEGATVEAYSGERAITDSKGKYEIKNIEKGSYALTVSKDGYKKGTIMTTLADIVNNADGVLLEANQSYVGKNGGTNTAKYDLYLKRTETSVVFNAVAEESIASDAGGYELWFAPDTRALNRQRDDVLYIRSYNNGTAVVVKRYSNGSNSAISEHNVTTTVNNKVITLEVPYATIARAKKASFTLDKTMDIGFTCESINANNKFDVLMSADIPEIKGNYSTSTELARSKTYQYLIFKADGTFDTLKNNSLNLYEFADLVNQSSAHKSGVDFSLSTMASVDETNTTIKQIAPVDDKNYMFNDRTTHSWWQYTMLNAIKGMYFNYDSIGAFSSITTATDGYVVYCGNNDMTTAGLHSNFVKVIADGPAYGLQVDKSTDYYVGYFEAGTTLTASAKDAIFVFEAQDHLIDVGQFETLPGKTFDAGFVGDGNKTPIERVFVTKKDEGLEFNVFTKNNIDPSIDQGIEAYIGFKSCVTRSTTTFTFKFMQNSKFTARYWPNNTQTDLTYKTGVTCSASGNCVTGFIPYEVFNRAETRLNVSKDSDVGFSINAIKGSNFTPDYGYNVPIVSSWVNGEITRGNTKAYYWVTKEGKVSFAPSDLSFDELVNAVNGSDAFNGVVFSKDTLATLDDVNLSTISMWGKMFTNRDNHLWDKYSPSALKEMHFVSRDLGATNTHTVSRSGYVIMMSIDSLIVQDQYKVAIPIIQNPGLITGVGYNLITLYARYVYAGEQIEVPSDSVVFTK